MNAETIFVLVNMIAVAGWLLLLAAPYSKMTRRLIDGMVLPAFLAAIYLVLLVSVIQTVPFEDYSFLGLVEVLADPWVAVLGWTHLLAFDLVVAIWMKRDAQKRNIRHLVMLAPYALTLFFGPVGLLSYILLSTNKKFNKKRKKSN